MLVTLGHIVRNLTAEKDLVWMPQTKPQWCFECHWLLCIVFRFFTVLKYLLRKWWVSLWQIVKTGSGLSNPWILRLLCMCLFGLFLYIETMYVFTSKLYWVMTLCRFLNTTSTTAYITYSDCISIAVRMSVKGTTEKHLVKFLMQFCYRSRYINSTEVLKSFALRRAKSRLKYSADSLVG